MKPKMSKKKHIRLSPRLNTPLMQLWCFLAFKSLVSLRGKSGWKKQLIFQGSDHVLSISEKTSSSPWRLPPVMGGTMGKSVVRPHLSLMRGNKAKSKKKCFYQRNSVTWSHMKMCMHFIWNYRGEEKCLVKSGLELNILFFIDIYWIMLMFRFWSQTSDKSHTQESPDLEDRELRCDQHFTVIDLAKDSILFLISQQVKGQS